MRVVPTLYPLEDRHPRLRLAPEPPTAEHLALQRGKEALGHRVIVGVTDRAHRGHDAGFLAALAEGVARILRSAVRVMNDPTGLTLGHRHLQRLQD